MSYFQLSGTQYFLKGFSLIIQPRIRLFVIIPLLINLLIFGFAMSYAWRQFNSVMSYMQQWLSAHTWMPSWLLGLQGLLWVVFMSLILIMISFTFTWVANLVAAPFNGLLAEAVEQHLTGVPLPANPWHTMLTQLLPTLWGEIVKLFYYLRWLMILMIIGLIPILNVISPILWFIFSAWMLTIQYTDYAMSSHGLKPVAQRKLLARKRLISLEFGSIVLLATLVPIINLLVIPVAVAGATCLWVYEFSTLSQK